MRNSIVSVRRRDWTVAVAPTSDGAGAAVAAGVLGDGMNVAVTGTGVLVGVGAGEHAAMLKSSTIGTSKTDTEICFISILFSCILTESLAVKVQEYAIPLFDATSIAAHFTPFLPFFMQTTSLCESRSSQSL